MQKNAQKSRAKKLTLLIALLLTIALAFSGCTLPAGSSNPPSSPRPGVTVPIYPDGKPTEDSKQNIGEEGVDMSEAYINLLGLKVSYDGSAHTAETLSDSKFAATYSRVAAAIQTTPALDPAEFAATNSELGVSATYISRVLWLYNYINQYRALASLILTELSQTYGLGLNAGYTLNNDLYGKVAYNETPVTETNKNVINMNVTETTTSITVENPYRGLGDATYTNGSTTVDFNLATTLTFATPTAQPSKAYPFALNLGATYAGTVVSLTNPYYDPSNIVNQPTTLDPDTGSSVPNPLYNPNHILGKQTISLVGTLSDSGVVNYELGTTTVPTLTPNTYAYLYNEMYSSYLGLKLLEAHTLATDKFIGAANEVTTDSFFAHYADWQALHNKLGFDATFYSLNQEPYVLADTFSTIVLDCVIGQTALQADASAGALSKNIENTVKQIVAKCLTAKMSKSGDNFTFDTTNGETYFKTVYCVEYRDYSPDELFGLNSDEETAGSVQAKSASTTTNTPRANSVGDCDVTVEGGADTMLILPEENYYSVVIMVKEGAEPCIMQGIITLFWAKNNNIWIDMAYRYVLQGADKIFAPIDYSLKPEVEEGEAAITNEFSGLVEKFEGEELTMDMADKCSIAVEDYNTPKIDTVKNKEITLTKFTNNHATTYSQVQNIASVVYQYNSELNHYYYDETSDACDYVELNFRTYLNEAAAETDTLPYCLSIMELVLSLESTM